MRNPRRNCLSYWFPILEAAGVKVPRTEIVRTNLHLSSILYAGDDSYPGDDLDPVRFESFIIELRAAADRIGYPAFLRTGQGSGKHNWRRCCYLSERMKIEDHVMALIEWSDMVDMIGLLTDVWCVRQMLPIKPIGVCDRYGGMPVTREFRFFVRDGKVVCSHPYWPRDALEKGGFKLGVVTGNWYEKLCRVPAGIDEIAEKVALAFVGDGAWSVDILEVGDDSWFVTDMAEAEASFHMPGCPYVGML